MKNKLFTLVIAGILVLFVGLVLFTNNDSSEKSNAGLKLLDIHGLEVAIDNPNKLYLPNHQGLYYQETDGKIQQLGSIRDDLMSFTLSPTKPSIFYASGHPRTGGNFGLIKTTDSGESWTDVADGLGGPVDFHTMAIDNTDEKIIYGYYQARLQRSTDSGNNWKYIDTAPEQIIQLSAGKDRGELYAATADGLQRSQDKGDNWTKLDSIDGTVTAVEVNPTSGQLFAYEVDRGLLTSDDNGKTWSSIDLGASNDPAMYIASSKSQPKQVYLITKSLTIYSSADSGATWSKR